ncbi:MAG: glycosyltransferase family 4 protein [Bacteroidales bacterium]|nr:glycosyltransferase family 4 protein [Bacteroidales bacterium]
MLKIVFIAPFDSPHIRRWFDYFDKNTSVDAHLLIASDLFNDKSLWSKGKALFTLRRKLIHTIKEMNPDIVNLHTLLFPNYAITKHVKSKIVITPWNGDVLWYKYGKELLILKYFNRIAEYIKENQIKKSLNQANLVTCNSLEMEKRVLSLLDKNIPTARVQVPGIYSDVWTKVDEGEKLIIRKELNLPTDAFIVFSPRSLASFYNIDIIIRAFHIALQKDNRLILVVKYLASNNLFELQNMVNDLDLQDKVIFVGKIDYVDVVRYFQVSDLCISISSKDSSPQSVVESLSCKTPVIAGDIPVLHELIQDGHNGFIVPCRDPQILAEKIVYVKQNKELMNQLAQNGRKTVLDHHDHYVNMSKMLNLFKAL